MIAYIKYPTQKSFHSSYSMVERARGSWVLAIVPKPNKFGEGERGGGELVLLFIIAALWDPTYHISTCPVNGELLYYFIITNSPFVSILLFLTCILCHPIQPKPPKQTPE